MTIEMKLQLVSFERAQRYLFVSSVWPTDRCVEYLSTLTDKMCNTFYKRLIMQLSWEMESFLRDKGAFTIYAEPVMGEYVAGPRSERAAKDAARVIKPSPTKVEIDVFGREVARSYHQWLRDGLERLATIELT